MASSEIKLLLQQYLDGTISEDDFKRLWQTLKDNDEDWLIALEDALEARTPQGLSTETEATEALAKIKEKISDKQKVHYLLNTKKIFRYAAAVAIIAAAILAINYTTKKKEFNPSQATAVTNIKDVEPGGQKALLTLADGSTIVLDNANNGQIAQQGKMQVVKLANGEIQYKAINSSTNSTATGENTMSTPRGGQYQLILPDGSKVWLNSESSITYPIAFTTNERKVKITGEAYFEVAKDKKKPFRVVTNDMTVEVLGTHFNVKAYADDGPTKTSLLEGSVKIDKQVLKPGQAFMNGKIVATDVDQDVAWKNGIFNFNNQNLSQVMKQLARWYDLEIVYTDGIPQKEYGGEIGRNLKLGQVLQGLENSGVHFELNGKRVTVSIKK